MIKIVVWLKRTYQSNNLIQNSHVQPFPFMSCKRKWKEEDEK